MVEEGICSSLQRGKRSNRWGLHPIPSVEDLIQLDSDTGAVNFLKALPVKMGTNGFPVEDAAGGAEDASYIRGATTGVVTSSRENVSATYPKMKQLFPALRVKPKVSTLTSSSDISKS